MSLVFKSLHHCSQTFQPFFQTYNNIVQPTTLFLFLLVFILFHKSSHSFSFSFKQNKLKKEDAFTRLNVAKIKSEWRDILRKIKCKELHEDLKAIKKECDESIKRKNSVIRRLLSDLDESEEIYSSMLHSHMNSIEKLIGEMKCMNSFDVFNRI